MVAGAVEDGDDQFAKTLAEGIGRERKGMPEGGVEREGGDESVPDGAGHLRAICQLVDVETGNADHAAIPSIWHQHGRHDGNGVGHPLGDVARAVDRIEGDVESRVILPPAAEPVPEEDPGGIVLDALPDDDLSADVNQVEHPVDGVAGGGIGGLLVAPSHPVHRMEGRVLGGADELEFDHPLQILCCANHIIFG